jgi:hypothetical protein
MQIRLLLRTFPLVSQFFLWFSVLQDLSMKQHKSQAGSAEGTAAAAAAAIVARLQFRRLLLQALIRIKRRQKQDLDQAAKLLIKAQVGVAQF